MNNKQKFGYTILGAVIMLIGVGVGAIVSPPLTAQRNGVFGKIQCTELTVIDKSGEPAIRLKTNDKLGPDNHIVIYDPLKQKSAIRLSSRVLHEWVSNHVDIFNPETGTSGISLDAYDSFSAIDLSAGDRHPKMLGAQQLIGLVASRGHGGQIFVTSPEGREIHFRVNDRADNDDAKSYIGIFDSESNLMWIVP